MQWAADIAKSVDADFAKAKTDLEGLAQGSGATAGEASSSSDALPVAPGAQSGASSAPGGGVIGYFSTLISNVKNPKQLAAEGYERLKEEAGKELHEQAVNYGFVKPAPKEGGEGSGEGSGGSGEEGSGEGAPPPSWTSVLPPFLVGPVERFGQFMNGEIDIKGLGICNCFVGPQTDKKDQTNQGSKAAYGLGVCVCCVGGQRSKDQEAAVREEIRQTLQVSIYLYQSIYLSIYIYILYIYRSRRRPSLTDLRDAPGAAESVSLCVYIRLHLPEEEQ